MSNRALVRKSGPFIEISEDGQRPLPPRICKTLEAVLSYMHMHFEYNNAYRADTGSAHQITHERRRLFQYDDCGRLVCQKGFLHKVRGKLREQGYEPVFVDQDPPKPERTYKADWDRVFDTFELRPRQDECLAAIDMHDGGLIDAPPAFGKTHVMAMIARMYPHAKIDIVTKRKDVVARIRNLLTRWIPSVGQVGGGKRDRNRRVTVYTADSVHHSDFNADILLADEAHELVTDRLAGRLSNYWHSRNFCFTATPDTRLDNAHFRLEGLFGPCIFRMTQQEAEANGLVTHVYVQWLDINCGGVDPVGNIQQPAAQKRHGIWRNMWRNRAIAEAVRSFLSDGLQVLILVDTVDHAIHLRSVLPEATLCYGENAVDGQRHARYVRDGLLQPDEIMSPQRRVELGQLFERRELMCVIATGVWSTGVSFDSLNVLVRADGGDSETFNVQIPGRVCRIDPQTGKQAGILVDFYDTWNNKFLGRSQNRRRAYHKRGWTQVLQDGEIWDPGRRASRVGT